MGFVLNCFPFIKLVVSFYPASVFHSWTYTTSNYFPPFTLSCPIRPSCHLNLFFLAVMLLSSNFSSQPKCNKSVSNVYLRSFYPCCIRLPVVSLVVFALAVYVPVACISTDITHCSKYFNFIFLVNLLDLFRIRTQSSFSIEFQAFSLLYLSFLSAYPCFLLQRTS